MEWLVTLSRYIIMARHAHWSISLRATENFSKQLDLKNSGRRDLSRSMETTQLIIWYSSVFRRVRVKTIAARF
jgi:hypothetical protein